MPDRKSKAPEGDKPRPEEAAADNSRDPLPPPGAESEPEAPAEPPVASPAAPDPVTVDATESAASEPEPATARSENAADAPAGRAETVDATDAAEAEAQEHEDEGGWSFAARALTLLLALIAGAVIGIWGAPKLATRLPSGLAPVASWLAPGQRDMAAEIARLQKQVDDGLGGVETRLAALGEADDTDARIKGAVDAARAELGSEIAAVKEDVARLGTGDASERIARLESSLQGQTTELASLKEQLSGTAAASGQLTEEAVQKIDVYRAELEGLRAEVGTLRGTVDGLSGRLDEVASAADREIETARAHVAEVQAQSDTALNAAGIQSDLALIRAAIAGGQPFAAPLEQLAAHGGPVVPPGLEAAAASGVATMAQLRDRFPDAAHAAIQASIIAGAGEGLLARSRAFLEAQMASRSLTPQAGPAPDAVLSRMEDRLRQDDLDGALSEAAALPSEAAAAMSDWLADARLRAQAVAGVAALESAQPATN